MQKEVVLRFVAMSDVHVGEPYDEEAMRFGEAMEASYAYAMSQEYKTLDALLLAGDMTKSGYENEVIAFKEVLDRNIRKETRPLLIMGNHEYFVESGAHVGKRWERIMKQTMNTHEVINGYHFIGISLTSYSGYTDQIEWVDRELQKAVAEDPEKPVFVQQHYHITNTVYGSDLWGTSDLTEVFDKYPQIIHFSGHSHYPINDPRSIWQENYTALGCGTLSYFELEPGMVYGSIPPKASDAFQFYIVEVHEDHSVTVKAYDGITKQFFGFEHHIEPPFVPEAFVYTKERAKKADKPYFAEGAEVQIEHITDTSVTLTIPQAIDKECIHSYRFDFYKDDKVEMSASIWSEFYFVDTPKTLTQEFLGLTPKTQYKLTVTAINSWGKECAEPLKAEFITE